MFLCGGFHQSMIIISLIGCDVLFSLGISFRFILISDWSMQMQFDYWVEQFFFDLLIYVNLPSYECYRKHSIIFQFCKQWKSEKTRSLNANYSQKPIDGIKTLLKERVYVNVVQTGN